MLVADLFPASRMEKTPSARRAAAHDKEIPSAIVTPLHGCKDADRPGPEVSRCTPSRAILQPNTAPTGLAHDTLADQLDADGVQCFDQLHQGIDIAADHVLTCFHALDGRHGQISQFGEATLVKAGQGSRRTQLGSGDHVLDITNHALHIILYLWHIAISQMRSTRAVVNRPAWCPCRA